MALTLLTLAYALAFTDRQILTLLMEDIKKDLQVGDAAMGALSGLGFSLFYVTFGLFLARLMDGGRRRRVVAACIALWSFMTSLSGLMQSYALLFLARIGVGCSEAGISPGATSLLADYFPKRLLPAAMGIFAMGIYLGSGVALIGGGLLIGWLATLPDPVIPGIGILRDWQMVFLLAGLPGLALAFFVRTLRAPPRRSLETRPDPRRQIPLCEVLRYLKHNHTIYFGIIGGFSLMIFVGNGTSAWIPAFLMRRFGWSAGEIGESYGVLVLAGGALGTLCGGLSAAGLRRVGFVTGNLIASLAAFIALVPLTCIFTHFADGQSTLMLIALMNFAAGFPFGGGIATLQEMTPPAMRAQIAALYSLCANIAGAALGPTSIGFLTEYVFHDENALPRAITLISAIASPLALIFLLIGYQGYRRRLRRKTIRTGINQSTGADSIFPEAGQ